MLGALMAPREVPTERTDPDTGRVVITMGKCPPHDWRQIER